MIKGAIFGVEGGLISPKYCINEGFIIRISSYYAWGSYYVKHTGEHERKVKKTNVWQDNMLMIGK